MASQQPGASAGADQANASQAPAQQMAALQPDQAPKAPGYAAFGTSSGAAVMFRDLASI